MAKEIKSYPFPSVFGSHKSMVNEAKTAELTDDTKVVLTDEYGDYLTEKYKLDRGEADPNRYPTSRLTKLFDKKSKDDDK